MDRMEVHKLRAVMRRAAMMRGRNGEAHALSPLKEDHYSYHQLIHVVSSVTAATAVCALVAGCLDLRQMTESSTVDRAGLVPKWVTTRETPRSQLFSV